MPKVNHWLLQLLLTRFRNCELVSLWFYHKYLKPNFKHDLTRISWKQRTAVFAIFAFEFYATKLWNKKRRNEEKPCTYQIKPGSNSSGLNPFLNGTFKTKILSRVFTSRNNISAEDFLTQKRMRTKIMVWNTNFKLQCNTGYHYTSIPKIGFFSQGPDGLPISVVIYIEIRIIIFFFT